MAEALVGGLSLAAQALTPESCCLHLLRLLLACPQLGHQDVRQQRRHRSHGEVQVVWVGLEQRLSELRDPAELLLAAGLRECQGPSARVDPSVCPPHSECSVAQPREQRQHPAVAVSAQGGHLPAGAGPLRPWTVGYLEARAQAAAQLADLPCVGRQKPEMQPALVPPHCWKPPLIRPEWQHCLLLQSQGSQGQM